MCESENFGDSDVEFGGGIKEFVLRQLPVCDDYFL
jgi:hypothetical protein